MNVPYTTYDSEANADYLRLAAKAVARTVKLTPTVHLDLAADGTIIGVETIGSPVDYAALYAVLTFGWPVAIAQGRQQAAQAIRASGRDPHRNLAWMYPDEAAKIAEGAPDA